MSTVLMMGLLLTFLEHEASLRERRSSIRYRVKLYRRSHGRR